MGGCAISLIVAIDFTASNGNPNTPNSLHAILPTQLNEYQQAIYALGGILSPYDSDNMYPVYGFGARIPPNGALSHCFPLNQNLSNPEVPGVPGIMDVYKFAVQQVVLYGPTNFTQVINVASQIASRGVSQTNQRYYILLIITDGEISDMDSTINEIVNASYLPMSIIIVGVGSGGFNNMNILDGDGGLLKSPFTKRIAERDIVQFVPFSKYKSVDPSRLAAETLAEVPNQFVEWMKKHGIHPNLRPPAPEFK